jgi:gamma-glutamylputrescine oxidase
MTVSVWQANGTQPVREVDFLIVGAGLVGCSAAYFAGQLGRQVTITDTRDVALGASSRNAGFMITGLDTYYHHAIERYGDAVVRDIWGLSITTHSHLRHFIKNGNVPIDPCGSTLLAESPEEARDLEDAARALDAAKLGLDFEYCSSDPLGRGYYAAIRQRQDAAVQPYQLVQSIFKQSGAELIANNEMYRIEQPDSDYVLVYTRQYIFKARDVLLCTNAYSIHVDPYFVGKVIPTRAQILVTAPLKERVVNTCGYSDYGYMYYRDTFDGRLLIGGGRKQNKALENDTTDDRVTDPVQRILEAYLRDKFPDIDAPVEQRWAGIMGFTVDGLPLVGTLPGKPRVAFCIACHGHGLALGAGTAERAVEMVVNGTNPGAVSASRL